MLELAAFDLEVMWILKLRPFGALTNIARGGNGGHTFYGEKRNRIAAKIQKNRVVTDHTREMQRQGRLGYKASDETKAKQRTAKVGVKQTPESIAARVAANTGKTRTPETKQRQKDAMTKWHAENPKTPKVLTPEEKAEKARIRGEKRRAEYAAMTPEDRATINAKRMEQYNKV